MSGVLERLGPYRLLGAPQYWGDRQVFHAVHDETGEPAAVHVLGDLRWTARELAQRRFHARQGLHHPNLAQLRSEGLLDQRPWFATELHEGALLSRWLERQGPPSIEPASPRAVAASDTLISVSVPTMVAPQEAHITASQTGLSESKISQILTMAHELCDVLTTLHAEGFVHGSLGPASVLLRDIDGSPVLLDPGVLEPDPQRAPCPPELLDGEPLGGRADVYLLGALLYELLAGQPPPSGQTNLVWATARGVPTPLARLVQRMVAPRPPMRPGHPSDCALELAMFLGPKAQLSRPRFTSALERAGSRPSLLIRASDELFHKETRGLFLRVAPLVDLSALLGAIGAQAQRRGLRVLRASRCPWGLPLGAFAPALASMPEPPDLSDDEALAPAGARGALLSAAEQALAGPPALLIVEGADSLDELSLLLLARLMRLPERFKVLLAGSSPPPGLDPLPELAVDPLESSELEELLRATLATPRPPPSLSRALQTLQQEDPWLIEQQLSSLVERKLLARDEIGVWRVSTSSSSDPAAGLLPTPELLTERLERLEPLQQALLAAAALLKVPSPPRWLLLLSGLSERDSPGLSALDVLLRRRWLTQLAEDSVGLIAGWLEAPAALLVDDQRRAEMNLRAARLLGSQRSSWARGRAAYHLIEQGETLAGARLLGGVGAQALRMGAPAAASRLLEEAHAELARGGAPPREVGRSLRWQAVALAELGQPEPARALLEEALLALGQRPLPRGLSALSSALLPDTPPQGDPELCAELARCNALLLRLWPASAPVERLMLARRASAASAALEAPPAGMALASVALADLAASLPLGPLARVAEGRVLEASIALGDRSLEVRTWAQIGASRLGEGRWAEAERALGRAAQRAAELRDQRLSLDALSRLSLAFLLQGELSRCLSTARSLPSLAQDEADAPWLALLAEAEVALLQRRELHAVEPLQRASQSAPSQALRGRACGLLAFALHRAGHRDAVETACLAAQTLPAQPPDLLAAEALHGALDVLTENRCPGPRSRDAARSLLRSLEQLARAAPVVRPRLWIQQAALDAVPRLLRAAADQARALDLPFSRAEALRRLAQLRHDDLAGRDLAAAEAILERLRSSEPHAFG